MSDRMKVAAAPITWGVSELAGWGFQMSRERVLGEMRHLGFEATEAGPPGYLPDDPDQRRGLLKRHGLKLVGGFVAAVLHTPDSGGLAQVENQARALAASGAEVIVLAAAMPEATYDHRQELSEEGWRGLGDALIDANRIAAAYGLTLAFHPHIGTAVQTSEDVERLLATTRTNLCLDTGHLALGGVNPVDIVAAAKDRIKHVHLKDVDLQLAGPVRAGELAYGDAVHRGVFKPLGQGDLDIKMVIEQLLPTGYDGWFVLEQDAALTAEPEPNRGPVMAAGQSLDYFRQVSGAAVSG